MALELGYNLALDMSYVLFRYLHFFAIFGLAGCLLIENMAIARTITPEDARNLARVDTYYGLSAAAVLLFGLILWLGVGRPPAFYNSNPLFLLKLGIFVLIGLFSIYPTVFLLKNRRTTTAEIPVPAPVIWLLRLELLLLVVMPILAVLMARGVGLVQG